MLALGMQAVVAVLGMAGAGLVVHLERAFEARARTELLADEEGRTSAEASVAYGLRHMTNASSAG